MSNDGPMILAATYIACGLVIWWCLRTEARERRQRQSQNN